MPATIRLHFGFRGGRGGGVQTAGSGVPSGFVKKRPSLSFRLNSVIWMNSLGDGSAFLVRFTRGAAAVRSREAGNGSPLPNSRRPLSPAASGRLWARPVAKQIERGTPTESPADSRRRLTMDLAIERRRKFRRRLEERDDQSRRSCFLRDLWRRTWGQSRLRRYAISASRSPSL
jgi:hypothetical protein